MGLALQWIAIEGSDRARLLDRLDLVEVGEVSDEMTVDVCCAVAPNGWLVLVARDCRFELPATLARASSDGFALGCEIVETVNYCQAWGFVDGAQVWSVRHDPDKDGDGVEAQGELPRQYADIARRLQAELDAAGDHPADYMFDAPLELATSICGYQAGGGLAADWVIVRRKHRVADSPVARYPTSIPDVLRTEILPLLRAHGWELTTARPDRYPHAEAHNLFRDMGGVEQLMWFDFKADDDVHFIVNFSVVDRASSPVGLILFGRVGPPRERMSMWRRFSWKRLLNLTRPIESAGDRVRVAMDGARRDILAADLFLCGGEQSPSIHIQRGLSKHTWPVLPDGRRVGSADDAASTPQHD